MATVTVGRPAVWSPVVQCTGVYAVRVYGCTGVRVYGCTGVPPTGVRILQYYCNRRIRAPFDLVEIQFS
eukprot:6570963-Pyramimonas_sp.AAC.2